MACYWNIKVWYLLDSFKYVCVRWHLLMLIKVTHTHTKKNTPKKKKNKLYRFFTNTLNETLYKWNLRSPVSKILFNLHSFLFWLRKLFLLWLRKCTHFCLLQETLRKWKPCFFGEDRACKGLWEDFPPQNLGLFRLNQNREPDRAIILGWAHPGLPVNLSDQSTGGWITCRRKH